MQPGLGVLRHIVCPRPRADVGLLGCVSAGGGLVVKELDKVVVHIHIGDDASLGVSDGQQVTWTEAVYRLSNTIDCLISSPCVTLAGLKTVREMLVAATGIGPRVSAALLTQYLQSHSNALDISIVLDTNSANLTFKRFNS